MRCEAVFIVLVGTSMLLVGCRGGETYVRPVQPVRVQVVAPSGPPGAVRYSGRIAAATEVNVAFRVGGYVTAVSTTTQPDRTRRLLQAGDIVQRSTVLASVRRSDYATKVDEFRGMRAGLKASVVQAKLDLSRSQELLKQRTIAQAEYDAIKARHDALVAEEIAAAARVGQAGIALSDTELRSPLDGVVIHRSVEVGELVSPGVSAFVIADTAKVKVVFGVPDSIQKQLKIDHHVTIRSEALPGRTFRGTVSKIAEKADERSRVFDIEATVDNRDQALKIGFIATAELDNPAAVAPRPAVPLSAVVQLPEKRDAFAVFVVTSQNGRSVASLRPVVLGDLVGNDVTITSGLTQGESVVVVGANHIRDGEQIAVIP